MKNKFKLLFLPTKQMVVVDEELPVWKSKCWVYGNEPHIISTILSREWFERLHDLKKYMSVVSCSEKLHCIPTLTTTYEEVIEMIEDAKADKHALKLHEDNKGSAEYLEGAIDSYLANPAKFTRDQMTEAMAFVLNEPLPNIEQCHEFIDSLLTPDSCYCELSEDLTKITKIIL